MNLAILLAQIEFSKFDFSKFNLASSALSSIKPTRNEYVCRTKKELEKLEKLYAAGKQKFVAVCGRRRIGKTVLLEEFMKGKEGIRFVAFRGSRELLYRSLLDMTNSFFAPDGPKYAFNDPDELFAFIFSKSLTSQFTFIIDEYAYLAEFFPEASSLLQKYIDMYKEKGKLVLVLCSSSRSFMETQVMGSSSPLYGRRDLSLRLGPFGITETRAMLPLLSDSRDIFKVWAITGGVPLYLSLFSSYINVDEAVRELFFEETGYFVNEVPHGKQECKKLSDSLFPPRLRFKQALRHSKQVRPFDPPCLIGAGKSC